MFRSACLIFNPVAGQSDSEQDLTVIKNILEPKFDLDIQFTTKEVNAGELASQALENNVDLIIASGGDGTVSAAAKALIGTDIPLGIIARGTANAFANALGLPDTIEAGCKMIIDGATRKVDVGNCNGKPMILLTGIGFEAETLDNANREAKNRWGMLAYIISGFKQLQNFNKFNAEIETNDKIISVAANAITIANAAPPTSILAQGTAGVIYDDGLFDVTIITPQNKMSAIAASLHLLQSTNNDEAATRDDIGYLRTKHIKVTTDPPQKIVLDGEVIGKTPLEVKSIPGGLTVFTPKDQAVQAEEKLEHLPGVNIETKN
ncbi:conserved protein of unknown function BmrU [Xenococcus sp. PCC 7305]|uniref:YegS/Rv2252/BmrU family lipid kinase n=1 Tax=Xenococcus sp. PCC 7305 TaxID=102125 RepID=UPI0002AD04C7|nr:YegS/Rv2252/BmrU family lipid kinase [Xenococcus sp. PCC 7305]ELS04153.1 conserved protein of unknown function BmrU [Xenococcus sp. PCC 7305]